MFYLLQGDKVTSNQSGNKALSQHLSAWAFGERGRLRVRNVDHHRQGEKESSNTYTITDTVVSIPMPLQLSLCGGGCLVLCDCRLI